MQRRALLAGSGLGLLAGCVAPQRLPGYQAAFQGYQVPEALLDAIRRRLRDQGLVEATVERDIVGRVRLAGRYRDEDEVETAQVILRSLVGLRAASPFYPEQVAERRWEREATRVLEEHAAARQRQAPASRKRALVVGINRFMDETHLRPLQGEDDARLVAERLQLAGYEVQALLGPQASKRRIETQLERLGAELGADDVLFIYISSHGALPLPGPEGGGSEGRRMSIVAYDSGDILGQRSRDATAYLLKLQQTSVRDGLFQALANRPSRQTRVLVDTCYSGDMLGALPGEGRDFIAAANDGRVERDSVSLAAWARLAEQARSRYTLLTATSPGELALGPPPERGGRFASPLDPARQLRGSYFTQALFEYLSVNDGLLQPAFAEAQRYTAATARSVSAGRQAQTPRMLSTMEAASDRL